jgi:hypothetical protein
MVKGVDGGGRSGALEPRGFGNRSVTDRHLWRQGMAGQSSYKNEHGPAANRMWPSTPNQPPHTNPRTRVDRARALHADGRPYGRRHAALSWRRCPAVRPVSYNRSCANELGVLRRRERSVCATRDGSRIGPTVGRDALGNGTRQCTHLGGRRDAARACGGISFWVSSRSARGRRPRARTDCAPAQFD